LREPRIHAPALTLPQRGRELGQLASEAPVVCKVEKVDYRYDSIPAVRCLTLSLRRGQITGLMGRNGSGKTTLLKLIAGLLRPQRGTIRADARAAYVPQDADALLFASTVEEELRGQAPEVMAPFHAWLRRYPRDLSSGERQQLAIAVVAA